MPGKETRTLWCLVYDDPAPFEVIVYDSDKVSQLKEDIKDKKVLRDVSASSLVLWQVRVFYRTA